MGTRVLAVGLLASVSANVYLLATSHREDNAVEVVAPVARSESPSIPRHQPEPVEHRATVKPVPPDIAALDRVALETRLADTEAKVEKLLPPSQKFGRGERTPENEERIKPFLDKVFHVKPGQEAPYEFECHGNVCRLTTRVSPFEWEHDLQTDPDGMGLFRGMQFGPEGVSMELEEPARAAALHLFVRLAMALKQSPQVTQCKLQNPMPGEITFELTLDTATHHISIAATGNLAGQASGVCIRRVLEDLVASTPVPPEVTALPGWPIRIEVP